MNTDQWGGLVRAIVPPLTAFAVAKGWIPVGSADTVIAAIAAIGAAGWSIYTNRSGKTIA